MANQDPGQGANRWLDQLYDDQVDDPMVQTALDAFKGSARDSKAFEAVFESFLAAWGQGFEASLAGLQARRQEILAQEKELAATFHGEMVDFLAQAQPGPLSEEARKVLRSKTELLKKLDITVTALNQKVLDALG